MKQIIIINGMGGSGKDTFVNFCSEYAKVLNVSSVDKVKEAAKILVGWNGEKDEISRKLLVDLKQLSINYNDYPTKYIINMAETFKNSEKEIMFIHIREIDEIKKIKELLHAKTLLITNSRVKIITSNASDANVNDYKYDFNILNNGTLKELENIAENFVLELQED